MSENQRKHARHQIRVDVKLTYTESDEQVLNTRDMSEGGMFLEAGDTIECPLGEMVHLTYFNPLDDNKETSKDAVIVRKTDDGIAIAFVEIDSF